MTDLKLSVADIKNVAIKTGTGYPDLYADNIRNRGRQGGLGDLFGLSQFGVNVVTLPPGAWSSQRHWHATEDEFVYVLEGEITLADDHGDHVMTSGMFAGFKANNGNGHHLKNLSDKPAIYLEVGARNATDNVVYSDIDMQAVKDGGPWRFLKKDGTGF